MRMYLCLLRVWPSVVLYVYGVGGVDGKHEGK